MQKILIVLFTLLSLTGCSFFSVHKMDIEQGNVITADMVNQIHVGMNKEEVTAIMGTPVLTNVFDQNRMDYVYTFKPGYGDLTEKYITFIFQGDRLSKIDGNIYSQFIK